MGYQIRLESKRSRDTRLLFCTTGILLRTLEGDGLLRDALGARFASGLLLSPQDSIPVCFLRRNVLVRRTRSLFSFPRGDPTVPDRRRPTCFRITLGGYVIRRSCVYRSDSEWVESLFVASSVF